MMIALIRLVLALVAAPWASKARLATENTALRYQVIVLRRKLPGRIRLQNSDRLFFVWLFRLFPSAVKAVVFIRPETILRWHRDGFRRYWRWKSRARGGRPPVDSELRTLIRRMSVENPLWGAPLRNHAPDIAAVDLLVVPTIGFSLLYGLGIVGLGRRRLIWVNVTSNPLHRGSHGNNRGFSMGSGTATSHS